jgi:hypothetical protein
VLLLLLLLLLLPSPLQVMFPMFGSIAIIWGVMLLRSQKHTVHAIHWLMLCLVVFKALTLMAQVSSRPQQQRALQLLLSAICCCRAGMD